MQEWIRNVAGICAFAYELTAPLAFVPIHFYTGARGRQISQAPSCIRTHPSHCNLHSSHMYTLILLSQFLDRRPRLNERIKIATAPYDFTNYVGFRNFSVWGEDGALIVRAASVWTLIDTEKLCPVRLTQELLLDINAPILRFKNRCILKTIQYRRHRHA